MIPVLKLVAGFMIGKIAAKLCLQGHFGMGVGIALSIVTTLLVCALIDRSFGNG
jgi:hypothetical protein